MKNSNKFVNRIVLNLGIITSISLLMSLSSSCNFNYPNYYTGIDISSRDIITYFQLTPVDSHIAYESDNISFIDDSIVICSFLSGKPIDADGNDVPLTQSVSISSLLDTSKRVEWNYGVWMGSVAKFFAWNGNEAYGYFYVGDGLIKVKKNQYREIIADLSLPILISNTKDYVLFNSGGQKKLFDYRKGELIWSWNYDKSNFRSCVIDKCFVKEDIINSVNGDSSCVKLSCYNIESKKLIWQREYTITNLIRGSNVYVTSKSVDWSLSYDSSGNVIIQTPNDINFIDIKSNKVKFNIQKPVSSSYQVPEFVAYPFYYCAFDDNIRCYNIKTKSLIWSIKSSSTVKSLNIWRQHLLFLANDSLYIAPLSKLKIDKVFHENVFYNILRNNIHNNYLLLNKKIYN